MTENLLYREHEVRQASDYVGWIGLVVRVRITTHDGITTTVAGRLQSTRDEHTRRSVPGRRGETAVVLAHSVFVFDSGDEAHVYHGEAGDDTPSGTQATIARHVVETAVQAGNPERDEEYARLAGKVPDPARADQIDRAGLTVAQHHAERALRVKHPNYAAEAHALRTALHEIISMKWTVSS